MPRAPKPTRVSPTTIAEDGSRNFLRPADVQGTVTTLRRLSGLALIAIYILLPWIQINGFPAVFLDVSHLRFHLFGITLAAQDYWLLFFGITGLGFSLFFVTALFGRLWCGFACPQTVFLEHIFRRVERFLEGPSSQQRALDASPWNANKLLRRGTKHVLFFLLSMAIAHIFLAYFVSLPGIYEMMAHSPSEHWSAFLFILAASGILYFNFAWFREQLCLIICPYGRLQSALIDDDTLVVGYDAVRGEPRGKPSKEGVGDCINCNRCVQVCPTGIDIRQGLQIECVSCMSCIDACSEVMLKLKRPTGLIRYDSTNGLERKKRRILRPRLALYMVMMTLGLTAAGISLSTLHAGKVAVSRMAGQPYYVSDGYVRNQFNLRLINKDTGTIAFRLQASDEAGLLQVEGLDEMIQVEGQQEVIRPMVLRVPEGAYQGQFQVEVIAEGVEKDFKQTLSVRFLGPDPRLLQSKLRGVGACLQIPPIALQCL